MTPQLKPHTGRSPWRRRRSFRLPMLVLLLPVCLWAGSGPTQAEIKVIHRARALQPGEIVVLKAESPHPLIRLRAAVFGREFPCFAEDGGLTWTGLIGIDLDTRPGQYTVKLVGADAAGKPAEAQYRLAVAAKTFPTRQLTVDEKFVNPPQKAMARIKKESERVRAIFDTITAQRFWRGDFTRPVPGAEISAFGKRSVYNGQSRSPHAGVDFRGATGTPIRAPNAGRVVLAANLYYSGNTVILDHGLGLYSYFGHMSAISVHEGDRVETRAIVGKVGATGLVTGPHLHWTVRLAGARVDPMSLLSLLGISE